MTRKILIISAVIIVFLTSFLRADEGMWIPLLLKQYNIVDMKKKGFKLTAEDIYSVNNACMKDGIVIFGRGCTGELISDKGLLITNHHCGYGQIQSHSSIENDYLTDGFWAMSNEEELSNPGLTVTFLVRMEDVTKKAFDGVTDEMSNSDRKELINKNIKKIEKEVNSDKQYKIEIKPFYYGNEYYMFVYEVYKDVRLVGAPPSAVGKFGGDTDNWMWPRHTGDFSLFRIYADKDNKPAEYSPDNIPYKPKFHFPISLKGVKKGDFTMVFGYPGSTEQYLTSYAVKQLMQKTNPARIAVRQKKLDIINNAMESDKKIRIQYSLKAARIANAWKKWIGENNGLKRLNAVSKKEELELSFQKWANEDKKRAVKYGGLLKEYDKLYEMLEPYDLAINYTHEALFSLDMMSYAGGFYNMQNLKGELLEEKLSGLKRSTGKHFKDYNLETDKKLFKEMIEIYYEYVDEEFLPDVYELIESKFKGDFDKYTEYVFSKTVFADEQKMNDFLENYSDKSKKILEKDPAYQLYQSLGILYTSKILFKWRSIKSEIEDLNYYYVKGLREMQPDKVFYPDANFTMRIAYGQVDDYEPKDAVTYNFFTTLEGIMEKDNPDIYDYDVPDKLKQLYEKKDYGKYGMKGEMPVCFTATNHTTGGNSGSPVINAYGQLIGVNFDRNWEGTMSDIMYDPDQCRNITLDIRYALFIIDKFAGAKHLVNEMSIVKNDFIMNKPEIRKAKPINPPEKLKKNNG